MWIFAILAGVGANLDKRSQYGPGIAKHLSRRVVFRVVVIVNDIVASFDAWLREDGTYEGVTATAIKRVLARQVEAAMKENRDYS